MYPFTSQLLRAHYKATGWDQDNEYSQLTQPTRALLDFDFVPGLHFSTGKSLPVVQFANSASLSVLSPLSVITAYNTPDHPHHSPTLTGSISYLTSGLQSFTVIPSKLASLTTVVDRFSVPVPPCGEHAPALRGGRGSAATYDVGKDYLIYGRLHLPTCRLDGLYTKRLSPSLQAMATLVSIPVSTPFSPTPPVAISGPDTSQPVPTNAVSPFWNLMLGLSHDTGRWSQQYTYSTEDGLFGARVLHNFSLSKRNYSSFPNPDCEKQVNEHNDIRKPLIDEEEAMDNVLKGRFSAGAEMYFSPRGKSAGVSTGIRFCTIPDPPGAPITQQPTVITATLNPIMGQISSAYGTKIGPNLALATRFDFNAFSFESNITFGGEWCQRSFIRSKTLSTSLANVDLDHSSGAMPMSLSTSTSQRGPVVKDMSGLSLSFWKAVKGDDEVLSIMKAKFSPVTGFAVMWEGKWRECLIGLGLTSEFMVTNLQPVIKGVFLELQYNTTST
ncbi:hypothetical protein CROQUDRAFT_661542 [Cronartium quercuum f. sp. fusiforme G11]|uniref:Mitochondrial distribution and morphology protein 10 n=1 Tax=Cronartium quercuum f. sp. fusiforme G11 TaxID=708437 RepID=A0A9P6NC68_9BASI|nr:hypothetical protein CROQUDRAFT_661542 [Cronartium quercuum f. sp. fusiforme G11]